MPPLKSCVRTGDRSAAYYHWRTPQDKTNPIGEENPARNISYVLHPPLE
jgi:hypothetical protein